MTYQTQIDRIVDTSTLLLSAGQSVALLGRVGVGKTRLAQRIAASLSQDVTVLAGRPTLEEAHLVGRLAGYQRTVELDRYVQSIKKKDERVSLTWRDGPLVAAMKTGGIFILDEFNRMPVALQCLLLPILEEGSLAIDHGDGSSGPVRAKAGFSMIMTGNTDDRSGVGTISDALADRLVQFLLPQPDEEAIITCIAETGLGLDAATNLFGRIAARHEALGLPVPRSFRPYTAIARVLSRLDSVDPADPPESLLEMLFPEQVAA